MQTQVATTWKARFQAYYYLCRFDKPIGTELVFWPTMWALWIQLRNTHQTHWLAVEKNASFLVAHLDWHPYRFS